MVETFKCFPCLVLVGRNKNIDNWCPLCHHRGSWQVETHFPFPVACGAESVYFPHCLGTVSFSVPSIHRANEFAEKMDSPCLCYSRKVTMKLCSSVGSGFPLTVISLSAKLRIVTSKSFLMQYQRLICSNKCRFSSQIYLSRYSRSY